MSISFDALPDFFFGRPSTKEAIEKIELEEAGLLPEDYKELLSKHGPGEGFIGKQYLILWDASEIIQFNKEYEVKKYAPGFLLIGSNGGGEGFAFDCRSKDKLIVALPFIGMSEVAAIEVADNVTDLFIKMKDGNASII